MYGFSIKNKEEFDFARIPVEVRRDNPEAVGFIMTVRKGDIAVVALYSNFLAQFEIGHRIEVCTYPLWEEWGAGSQNIKINSDFTFSQDLGSSSINLNVRYGFIHSVHIEEVLRDIDAAKEAAKNLRIKINVRPL